MKKTLITLLIIFSISMVFAQQDNRLKGIEKSLTSILEISKAPGFAVAIVEGNKILYAKGFGYSDYENKIRTDTNTLFAIGSCTKAFTSSILGQLRNEDKISFEDSPSKYISELQFFNNEMNSNVNIKDLMSHRTGLPRHDSSWFLFPTNNKDSLLLRVSHQEPFIGVRQKWEYNNFMFLAQGIIAERITGKSWEENIKERFFKPLGMTRSNVSIEELKKSSNIAIGYELIKDSIISPMDYYNIAGMSPAGSINSSVNDMSKWLITWINKGKFNEQQILPDTYVNEAISSQMVIEAALPNKEFPDMHLSNYGYAWFISSYKGHYQVEHSGNINGFSASVAFYPSDNIGVIVLTNQNDSAVPSLVRKTVADRMLKTQKLDWANRLKEIKIKAQKEEKKKEEGAKTDVKSGKTENTTLSHILQDYTGKYLNPGYGEFEILGQNDSLFAKFKLRKFYLKHSNYDVFEPFDVTESGIDILNTGTLRLNFTTNNIGEISTVKINFESALENPIEFIHKPNIIDVDTNTLEKYVGDYDLSGTLIKIYIKNKNRLYLFVKGQPEYELLPTDKDKFSFKKVEGYKVQFLDSSEKLITNMIIIKPDGSSKATRK